MGAYEYALFGEILEREAPQIAQNKGKFTIKFTRYGQNYTATLTNEGGEMVLQSLERD